MKTSQALLERLQEQGADLPPCTELRRTYRNRQTGIGSWSWFAWCPLALDHPEHYAHKDLHVGSHWPMRTLLAAPGLTFSELRNAGDTCIEPEPEQEGS